MRSDWYVFDSLSDLLDAVRRGWHRGAPEQPATQWLDAAVERVWIAFAASEGVDRLAWLRELVRLHEGALELAVGVIDRMDAKLLARFGLRASSVQEHLVWRIMDAPEAALPVRLREQLAVNLPVDPHPRRVSIEEPPDGVLLRCSSHEQYRTTTQKSAVRALCTMPAGQSLLITMPTGSGKSLLFQLGVRWWNELASERERACVLVIVPTVALALAHEHTLRRIEGLEGSRALTGALSRQERDELFLGFRRGEVPVLLAAPESALGSAREDLLRVAASLSDRPLAERGRLAAVFVDEAHIIHSWGPSFRPDFQRLPGLVEQLREKNPSLRTVLLSATVGREAKQLLRQQYGKDREMLEVAAQAPRTELDLCIHHFDDAGQRDRAVIDLVDLLPRPMLLYTTKVEDAERIYAALSARGYRRLACFTGNTGPLERQRIVDDWQVANLDIVVATSAFGMGIDKSDVRAVVHACLPEDAARLYQEIGRAGRDGHQALAVVLSARRDESLAVRMGSGKVLGVDTAKERWMSLVDQARREGPISAQTFAVSLDAPLERLPPRTGRHHLGWYKSLLVQLQRYGALEVLAIDETRDRWTVRMLEPGLLDSDTAAQLVEQYLAARTEETRAARQRVDALVQLVRATRIVGDDTDAAEDEVDVAEDPLLDYSCLMLALFEQVEDSLEIQEPCGRCMCCRQLKQQPPERVRHQGGTAVWATPTIGDDPWVGARVAFTRDPEYRDLHNVIRDSVRVGFRQFIVPDGRATDAARVLAEYEGHPGLVLEAQQMLTDVWRAMPIATVLFFDPTLGDRARTMLYTRTRDHVLANPRAGLLFVAPYDLQVEGKLLSAIASAHGPMNIEDLVYHSGAHS
jgi:ATP-dependent DNA helicase RecQ